jgi:hypothetical protein
MILFCDFYIVSSKSDLLNPESSIEICNNKRLAFEKSIRSNNNSYRYQTKLSISKYTIASYAALVWDYAIIRFECEDFDDGVDFYKFCRNEFPRAELVNSRSDSAKKYSSSLVKLKKYGNPWIFFSPNNDHPYIGIENHLNHYLELAEKHELLFPDSIVSILYSHYTESMCNIKPGMRLWARYANIFPKIIHETKEAYVSLLNKLCCDSINIFRLDFLLDVFNNTKNKGRVIRLEDTEYYLSNEKKHISIIPKVEICRHYDGYFHWPDLRANIVNAPPPLFIPSGFFEKEINVRYGYRDYINNCVNIDPLAVNCRYINSDGPDLNCLYDDIPLFWRSRIVKCDYNHRLYLNISRNKLIYYQRLIDPWYNTSKVVNIFISIMVILVNKYTLINKFQNWMYNNYGSSVLYKWAKKTKSILAK